MSVYKSAAFKEHEQVCFFHDAASGTKAIIAIHNTQLGPSLGGCRMFPYATEQDALDDVLRLAEGMTYKAAMANLPQGGGKSVIIGDPRQDKSSAMMQAMGRFVESLGGRYIIAEDSGISVSDVTTIAENTDYVGGCSALHRYDGAEHDGNPAPATAYGVFVGLKAAVQYKLDCNLEGLTIAIQGIGQVGRRLVEHCLDAGANLIIADAFAENTVPYLSHPNVTVCGVDDIHAQSCDVFSPCALGGSLNQQTVPDIKAKVIAGAANNQLADDSIGDALLAKRILYAPDYVINAGGIIDIYHQEQGNAPDKIKAHLESIGETLTQIFVQAERLGINTAAIANRMAIAKIESPTQNL